MVNLATSPAILHFICHVIRHRMHTTVHIFSERSVCRDDEVHRLIGAKSVIIKRRR